MYLPNRLNQERRLLHSRWWRDASHLLESHKGLIGFTLLCLYFLGASGQAAGKYLWYDELITTKIALLPSNKAILGFFRAGRDTTSATCALLDHIALKIPASPELTARAPFILAFALLLILVYLFLHRCYPAGFALSGAMLTFAPLAIRNYAVEARGYVLLMLGTALAMFCWQTLIRRSQLRFPSLVGFWFGLALALNAHTFGILLFVPFGLAELWRTYMRRSIDWPVWIALVIFPLGLLPVLPGQRLAQHFYGGHFWAQPQLQDFFSPYQLVLFSIGSLFYFIPLPFFVLSFRFKWNHQDTPIMTTTRTSRLGFSQPEWVLIVALTLLPIYALPFAFAIHVFRSVYVLEFFIGLVVLTTAVMAESVAQSQRAGLLLFVSVFICTFESAASSIPAGVHAVLHPLSVHKSLVRSYNLQPWVQDLKQSDLPVVASEHLTYAQLAFYGDPSLVGRLLALTNLGEVEQAPSSETGQKNLVLFGSTLGFRTADVHQYIPTHREFLLTGKADYGDWITAYLLKMQGAGQASMVFLGPANIVPKGYAPVLDYKVRIE